MKPSKRLMVSMPKLLNVPGLEGLNLKLVKPKKNFFKNLQNLNSIWGDGYIDNLRDIEQ